jgi:hypothetical protein
MILEIFKPPKINEKANSAQQQQLIPSYTDICKER